MTAEISMPSEARVVDALSYVVGDAASAGPRRGDCAYERFRNLK